MNAELGVLIGCDVPASLDSEVVHRFIHELRTRCHAAQLAVLMAFDGGQLLLMIEGPRQSTEILIERLIADRRFEAWRICWREAQVMRRLHAGFEVVFPAMEDGGDSGLLAFVFSREGEAAREAFFRCIQQFDRA